MSKLTLKVEIPKTDAELQADPDSSEFLKAELPATYEVCDRCRGTGSHVNPNIDGNGITESEMYELGPDFREDYFAGVYDVTCEECKGLRVVLVIDEKSCNPEQQKLLKRHWAHQDELADEARADRQTLYWESGGTMGSR